MTLGEVGWKWAPEVSAPGGAADWKPQWLLFWILHGIYAETTFPLGCFQPVSRPGGDKTPGPSCRLWDPCHRWHWLEASPSAWLSFPPKSVVMEALPHRPPSFPVSFHWCPTCMGGEGFLPAFAHLFSLIPQRHFPPQITCTSNLVLGSTFQRIENILSFCCQLGPWWPCAGLRSCFCGLARRSWPTVALGPKPACCLFLQITLCCRAARPSGVCAVWLLLCYTARRDSFHRHSMACKAKETYHVALYKRSFANRWSRVACLVPWTVFG